jgi:hypothetical protein
MERSLNMRFLGLALVAGAMLSVSPARADCSASDIFNAAKTTVGGLGSCAKACADGAGCAAASALTSALTGIAASGAQGAVDSFCSQAEGLSNVKTVTDLLNKAGASSIAQIASLLDTVGSLSMVVKCACETEQGAGALGADLGDCMKDILCALQEALHMGSCDCAIPSPAMVNCAAIDVKTCSSYGGRFEQWHHPECIVPGGIANSQPNCNNSGSYMEDWQYTLSCTTTAEGTLVQALPPTAKGTGCNGIFYCFCPAPMVAAWLQNPNPDKDWDKYAFTCECPKDTHPGATMPNGISSCLCDNTNKPADFKSLLGMCPPPECPSGQVHWGAADGPCVTPCSDPKQGMALDGSCCNPAQMTTCGTCCAPGTIPDPKSGSCVPAPQPPK